MFPLEHLVQAFPQRLAGEKLVSLDEEDNDVSALRLVVKVLVTEQRSFAAPVLSAEDNRRPVVGKCSYKVADTLG